MTAASFAMPESLPEIYFDPYFEQEAVKVLPGSYYVTGRDMILVSVLGSSVCACVKDSVTGVGGICHFMLPEPKAVKGWEAIAFRYGEHAMSMLISQLLKSGARHNRLQAKIFGACNSLKSPAGFQMGNYNSRFVETFLKQQQIPVLSKDLMDIYPRKVYFFPHSGRVLVKKLKKLNNRTLLDREADFYLRLSKMSFTEEVEV